MSGWLDWLVAHGEADAAATAEVERVLEAAALEPGDTVVDVGAGLGLLTFAARERIGDGLVIAVDPSAAVLEELLRLAHEAEVSGIMYLVGDAEVLPLPDASVDAALLRSVLVHVEETESAVRELARVVRPGGRLSLREPLGHAGTYLSQAVDWSALGELGARAAAVSADAATTDAPMPLDPDALAAALRSAGFVDADLDVDDPGEAWVVTEESVAARLDARGAPGLPSLRERWAAAFEPTEIESLVAHLERLAGTTVRFARPQLFLRAVRG